MRLTGNDAEAFWILGGLVSLAAASPDAPAALELRKFASSPVALDKIEVRHLSPDATTVSFGGDVMEGGDMIIGDATLDVTATRDASMPEFNIVTYTAEPHVRTDGAER